MKQDIKQSTAKIPEGYKNTLLGIIPNEWEVKKIKEIGQVVTGKTPATSEKENYGDSYLFVSPVDLSDLKYIKNTEKKLSLIGFEKSRKLPKGAVLFTCIGLIGKVGISLCDLSCNQQINAIICNELMFNEYLYYELRIRASKIKLIAGEQVLPIINKSDFENVKILIPPLPEQRKIAEVLSTWDKAIEKQTLLIEKLELRKKGLMQQLLTGKKRLHGFSEEWKTVKLNDLGFFFKGMGVPKDKVNAEGKYKCLTYGDLYTKYEIKIDNVKTYISQDIANISQEIQYGDICFAGSGETKEDIGKCAVFLDGKIGYVGGDIIVFRKSLNINSLFLSYALNTEYVNKQKYSLGQGHSVVHIYISQLEQITIYLPGIEEQNAIAEILSVCDNEITLAKQKLDTLRQQKKGLMQVLLTGKKRVEL